MRRDAPCIVLTLGWLWLGGLPSAEALDQKVEDLSASVEVAPDFSFSLDNPHLAFGVLGPKMTKVLGEGRYYNQVTCRSNSGRSWYLKAQILSLKLMGGAVASLAPSSLEWRLVESTGDAGTSRGDFQPFASDPVLVYTSQGDDNLGQEVVLRFQYRLTTPLDTPAGTYLGEVIFTMAETP